VRNKIAAKTHTTDEIIWKELG